MKYSVENDLSIFEFHDSMFSLVSFDGKDLTFSVKHLNIHKNTPQNPSEFDLEIDTAQITFKNFHDLSYEPGVAFQKGEDGQFYPVGTAMVYTGQEATNHLLNELNHTVHIYHFEKEDSGYSIGGSGIEPYFTLEFDFDNVEVCWETYKKKAWYELHRQYRYDAVLHTPNGDKTVQLTMYCNDEEVYLKGVLLSPPAVSVYCHFEGEDYWGRGRDYFGIDAFADLQKQLPADVQLKCCLTCRHGNFCPIGNDDNEVFCTKDVQITQKSDLYFYTEDETERKNRSRQYCNVCENYQPQSEDFFTYNDFGCYMQQK